MNYLKHYISLCRTRLLRNTDEYVEKHHIFPVSIFGNNNCIVELTHREHYIAHQLLWKICKRRYGNLSENTRKMASAFHMMVYCIGDTKRMYNLNSRLYSSAAIACRESKMGRKRNDMKGKRYFGASPEKVREGLRKMAEKKLGVKVKYPKNRKSSPRNGNTAKKISESRLKTKEKYVNMSEEQFRDWLSTQKMYNDNGKKNGNVTRAIKWREENENNK